MFVYTSFILLTLFLLVILKYFVNDWFIKLLGIPLFPIYLIV